MTFPYNSTRWITIAELIRLFQLFLILWGAVAGVIELDVLFNIPKAGLFVHHTDYFLRLKKVHVT